MNIVIDFYGISNNQYMRKNLVLLFLQFRLLIGSNKLFPLYLIVYTFISLHPKHVHFPFSVNSNTLWYGRFFLHAHNRSDWDIIYSGLELVSLNTTATYTSLEHLTKLWYIVI